MIHLETTLDKAKRNVKIPHSLDTRLRVKAARERRYIGEVVAEVLEQSLPDLERLPWADWCAATVPPPAEDRWANEPIRSSTINVPLPLWDRLNVAAVAHRISVSDYLSRILAARLPELS